MKLISANMDMINRSPELVDISSWAPANSCAALKMLRLDQLHPVVSGNKWFKLRYQLEAAAEAGKDVLLSFGGGYSNHLHALAYAASEHGFGSVGMVRGDYREGLTPTLESCAALGMRLHFLSKSDYDRISQSGEALQKQYPEAFIIPEGGANLLGQRGAACIARFIPEGTTDVCVAVGTGTTLAGLYIGLKPGIRLHGYCAAANCDAARSMIGRRFLAGSLQIYTPPGVRFGKWTPEQLGFMQRFYRETGIPLDVVYTGKMMQELDMQLRAGTFPPDATIVCIHTGGLQGNPEDIFD